MNVNFIKKYFPDLLSWEELSDLINIRPLFNYDRVHLFSQKEYKWEKHSWCKDQTCIPSSILKDEIDNNIVYFTDMSKCTEKINYLSAVIENEYESPVDAHIYVSKNVDIDHPFGIHYDHSHNVIVQCEGQTTFEVWEKVNHKEGDININLSVDEDPIIKVVMDPGDAIFVPAYYLHRATSITPRLSVSFPYPPHNKTGFQERDWIKL